ncbi:Hypothetical protein CINCED_3A018064 [Cinara cedri]|nr:Hypothetical protein CINCED_3A018064 [Cinara cedri]
MAITASQVSGLSIDDVYAQNEVNGLSGEMQYPTISPAIETADSVQLTPPLSTPTATTLEEENPKLMNVEDF